MTTLFKEVNYSLNKLIADIDLGQIGLPEIQRPFVWPNTKVRDLFDSMYKGFPVGYLLFWSSENWANMDYEIFLADRRKRIAQVIKNGFARLT